MKQAGFTLSEMMVVVAITAILLTIGVPSFAGLVRDTRLTGATNAIVASLYVARSEALKRHTRAVMCPSADGASCAQQGGWQQGWLVFSDVNNNARVDAGEAIVLKQPALAQGLLATSTDSTSRYISYTPLGDTRQVSGAFQGGTLKLCFPSAGQSPARTVVISRTGRARTTRLSAASCPW